MKNVKKIAQKYLDYIKTNGIPVTGAYLFGSYAKGSANKFSDIDICVISPNFGKDYINESLLLKKATNKIDYRIEPIPFSPKDVNNKYSSLSVEINKHGIPLT